MVGKTSRDCTTIQQSTKTTNWDLFADVKSLQGRQNEGLGRKSKRNRVHLKAAARHYKYICAMYIVYF